ncbi:sel1 repeat family protein [Candidatus Babeliales bacterium]|nr:sel1 repeat family protein [Candidatus Babeliales bacterium]
MLNKILVLLTILNLNIFHLFSEPARPADEHNKIKLHQIPPVYLNALGQQKTPELDLTEQEPLLFLEPFNEIFDKMSLNTPWPIAIAAYEINEEVRWKVWDAALFNYHIFRITPANYKKILSDSYIPRKNRDPMGMFCNGHILYMTLTKNPDGTISQKFLGTSRDAFAIPRDPKTKELINLIIPTLSQETPDPESLEKIARYYENGEGTPCDPNEARKYRNLVQQKSQRKEASSSKQFLNILRTAIDYLTLDPELEIQIPQSFPGTKHIKKETKEIEALIEERKNKMLPPVFADLIRTDGSREIRDGIALNEKLFPDEDFSTLNKSSLDVLIPDPTIVNILYFTVINGKRQNICSVEDLFVYGKRPDQFFLRAMVSGDPDIFNRVGCYYSDEAKKEKNDRNVAKNLSLALSLFKMAAHAGDIHAEANLAKFHQLELVP